MGAQAQAGLEERAEFLLGLRARGIGDLAVLRAMETVPRALFVPHRHADLANRNMSLPIACGQTMPEPFLVARMMEALRLTPTSRVLEIGAGSGYATAIAARLSAHVVAIERFQTLAISAMARLEKLGIGNATIVWGDGLAITPSLGLFDAIVIHAVQSPVPENLLAVLAGAGTLVAASAGVVGGGGQYLRAMTRNGKGGWDEVLLCPSRLRPLIAGISLGL